MIFASPFLIALLPIWAGVARRLQGPPEAATSKLRPGFFLRDGRPIGRIDAIAHTHPENHDLSLSDPAAELA